MKREILDFLGLLNRDKDTKYYYVCHEYEVLKTGKTTKGSLVLKNTHPFVWLRKQRDILTNCNVNLVDFREITEYEYAIALNNGLVSR